MVKNKKISRRPLKGVVLIMVVTVMMMLIILLLATMAVVSTAQNRYYTKYEENQAYYTARSALEVFVNNVYKDKTYVAYEGTNKAEYVYYNESTHSDDTAEMSQSAALQLDTYRLKAHAATVEEYNDPSFDKTSFSTDYWVNMAGVYDQSDPAEKHLYDYYENPDLEYIEYEVELPRVTNDATGDDYGIMADDHGEPVKIRLEMVARTYKGYEAGASEADNKKAIAAASRSKDQYYIKATTSVDGGGNGGDGKAQLIYTPDIEEPAFKGAITAAGAVNGVDNSLIIDGFAVYNDTSFTNDSYLVGESFAGGKLGGSASIMSFGMTRGECVYCKGITSVPNNFALISLSDVSDEADVPLFYVDGDCNFPNNVSWGGGKDVLPADQLTNRVDMVVTGDMNIKNFNVNGNIIVKGDLNITGDYIHLAPNCYFIVGGNVTVSNAANIKNTLVNVPIYCGGDFKVNDLGNLGISGTPFTNLHMLEGKHVYNGVTALPVEKFGTGLKIGSGIDDYGKLGILTSFDSTAFDEYLNFEGTDNKAQNTEKGWQTYIPKALGSTVEKTDGQDDYSRTVPHADSRYGDFYLKDENGNDVLDAYGNHEFVDSKKYAGTGSKDDRDAGNYDEMLFDPTTEAYDNTIRSSGTYSVSDEKDFYLTSCSNANISFKGTGTANVYVAANMSFSNDNMILVDDDTTVNFYFPAGNYFWNCPVLTQSIYDHITARHYLAFGKKGTGAYKCEKSPQINYYMEEGTVFSAQDGKCMLAGYVYAPDASVTINKGWSGGGTCQFYYNNDLVKNAGGGAFNTFPAIVGAIFCKDFHTMNMPALCYVPQEENPNPGEPLVKKTKNYYYPKG